MNKEAFMLKKIFSIVICVMLVLLLPIVAIAQNKDSNVVVKEDEVVKGDFFTAGDFVKNMGTVKGDVFAAAVTEFENKGKVSGDIIVGAGNTKIDGSVDGDIRIGSGNLIITGEIGKNVTSLSKVLRLESKGAVDGSISALSEDVSIDGIVGGDFRGFADRVIINGEIKGNVNLETEKLTFGPNAKIDGNLTYTSSEKVDIPKGVVIGETTYKLKKKDLEDENKEKGIGTFEIVGKAIKILSYLIVSFLLTLIFSSFMKKTSTTITEKPWPTLGVGIVALITIPIASLLLLITVIGIPIGLISFVIYGLLLYLSKIPAGLWIGEKILKSEEKPYLPMILGMLLLLLVGFIPYLGRIISFIAILLGIGSYLLNIKETIQKSKKIKTLEE